MKKIGWETKLITYLHKVTEKKFRPGELDCILFSAGAVKAITGTDYAKPFKGKYKTIDDGLALLKDLGFNSHVDYVASLLPELPSVLHAQRGDVAIVKDMNGNDAIGIVQSDHVYLMTLNGLTLVPLLDATRAFRT